MRGDEAFRVYGREQMTFFGAFRTRVEAEAEMTKLAAREAWARTYHPGGFEIRQVVVETDFEIPSRPTPRDKWALRTRPLSNGSDATDSTEVEVCRRAAKGLEPVASYVRNYRMLSTFEPFRQGAEELALISRDYTATAVLSLSTGKVIAEETGDQRGFCPAGFFVPDWFDVNDPRVIPGSEHWNADHEWPTGRFGFVWGCTWGDDTSWKLQHLDLSRVSEGVIRRDDRFGYLEVATHGWTPPWLDLQRSIDARPSDPPTFLRAWMESGVARVRVATDLRFELESGQLDPWQLKNLLREESGPE